MPVLCSTSAPYVAQRVLLLFAICSLSQLGGFCFGTQWGLLDLGLLFRVGRATTPYICATNAPWYKSKITPISRFASHLGCWLSSADGYEVRMLFRPFRMQPRTNCFPRNALMPKISSSLQIQKAWSPARLGFFRRGYEISGLVRCHRRMGYAGQLPLLRNTTTYYCSTQCPVCGIESAALLHSPDIEISPWQALGAATETCCGRRKPGLAAILLFFFSPPRFFPRIRTLGSHPGQHQHRARHEQRQNA